jgi:hypothetical protein
VSVLAFGDLEAVHDDVELPVVSDQFHETRQIVMHALLLTEMFIGPA